MDPNRKIIASVDKRKDDLKGATLTIMIMGQSGGIRSFRFSKSVILCSVLFFLLYIPGSILLINRYFDLNRRYIDQGEAINKLQNELTGRRIVFRQNAQHEANLVDLERYKLGLLQLTEEELTFKNEDVAIITSSEEGQSSVDDEIAVNPVTPHKAGISDLTLKRESDFVSIEFKLLNKRTDGNPIEGYIHIIGFGKDPDPPTDWTYFNNKLAKGFPTNYRQGLGFLIQRFKPYERMFRQTSGGELPGEIRVVVYDRSGELIYADDFEVHNGT